MSTTVYVKYSLVFLLFTASFVLATFTQIENQLNTVSTDAANWENVISLFPNGVDDVLIGAEVSPEIIQPYIGVCLKLAGCSPIG